MNKWFISDTHFSHANIIRYAGRPFQTVDEMNERLVENWNALVAPEDIVFFLGDFGLAKIDFLTELCARLQGHKICIRGNHDGPAAKMLKMGFSLVVQSAFLNMGRHQVETYSHPKSPGTCSFSAPWTRPRETA